MQNHTAKAARATIFLGDIPLEVFQLPNGEYRLSQTGVGEAVKRSDKALRRFLQSNSAHAIPHKDYRPDRVGIVGTGGSFVAVPVNLAIAFWTKEAMSANVDAALLLGACAAEAIERRADAVFGVQRNEAEREERLKARLQGKRVRRSFTDAIADYLDRHPELSEKCREWIYVNSSEAVNRVVFNKRAWELRNERGADRHSLRDTFTAQELLLVQEVEDVAQRLVDHQDEHPPQAVYLAGQRLLLGQRQGIAVKKTNPDRVLTASGRRR